MDACHALHEKFWLAKTTLLPYCMIARCVSPLGNGSLKLECLLDTGLCRVPLRRINFSLGRPIAPALSNLGIPNTLADSHYLNLKYPLLPHYPNLEDTHRSGAHPTVGYPLLWHSFKSSRDMCRKVLRRKESTVEKKVACGVHLLELNTQKSFVVERPYERINAIAG